MNVLVVTSGYPPEHSGSGLRIHETYVRLQRLHSELCWRVLTRRRGSGNEAKEPSGPKAVESLPPLRSDHLAFAPVQATLEWFRLRRRLGEGLLSGVDLVHTAGFTWLTVFLCRKARGRGIPVIRELTSTADTGVGRGLGGRIFSAVVRSLNRSADLLVAISPRLQREVRESGVERPVWCRPNPVDTDRFRPPERSERQTARGDLLEEWNSSGDNVVVLHVGHIRPNKNQLLLVQALRYLPDRFKLALVGPAHAEDRPYLDEIRENAAAFSVEGRTLVVPTFRTDVERWMWAADLLALPSRREGLGNVMLEALCTGLPVAATRLPGVTDWIVEPGVNGFLFELSPADVAEKIRAAAKLTTERREIARRAAERFDAVAIDEAYWNRMRNLVSDAPATGVPQSPEPS